MLHLASSKSYTAIHSKTELPLKRDLHRYTVMMALLFSPLRKNGYLVTATINVIDAKRQIKVRI